MAIEGFNAVFPSIDDSAFIAASADLIGDVTIGENASVWYNATLRGDINYISVGANSNIQDNVVIHLSDDYGVDIGEWVTVGHGAIIHACKIEDECLIGMGACILDGAHIGKNCIVGANALITGGTVIEAGSLVLGSPAKVVKKLSAEEQKEIKSWAVKYVKGSRKYVQRPENEF